MINFEAFWDVLEWFIMKCSLKHLLISFWISVLRYFRTLQTHIEDFFFFFKNILNQDALEHFDFPPLKYPTFFLIQTVFLFSHSNGLSFSKLEHIYLLYFYGIHRNSWETKLSSTYLNIPKLMIKHTKMHTTENSKLHILKIL